jgi:hypothetical protein
MNLSVLWSVMSANVFILWGVHLNFGKTSKGFGNPWEGPVCPFWFRYEKKLGIILSQRPGS